MIREIDDFASLFGSSLRLDEDRVVRKRNRLFLTDESLRRATSGDFFYAGAYLGEIAGGKLFPGFELLRRLAEEKKANKVVVDRKSEWLFVCGRDVFKRGILSVVGSVREGEHVLVLNSHGECLGYGRVLCDLGKAKRGVVVQNVLDVGDFLRREKAT